MYNTIIHPTWLSIVFENRNQAYGAFQLRKEYDRNMVGGLIVSHAILAGFFGLVWAAYTFAPKEIKTQIEDIPFDVFEVNLTPKPKIIEIVTPKAQVVKNISSKRYVKYVVTDDKDVAKSEIPKVKDYKNVAISPIDNTGEGLAITDNPVGVGGGIDIGIDIPKPEEYLTYAEKMPSFPANYGSIASFIGKEIHYPRVALQNSVTGLVYIQFIVDENGNIIHPEIIQSLGSGCDEEVLRILAVMPRWNPGMVNGKPVKVRMTLPVNFRMTD